MTVFPLEIIIPVYNEGKNINDVFGLLQKKVKVKFRVLLCYDNDNDNTLDSYGQSHYHFEIIHVKNKSIGAHGAIMTGMNYSKSKSVIIFPADDIINQNIIDKMYEKFLNGCSIVVASRFITGGSMKNCPPLKSFLVRFASKTLYLFSSIPVQDASNGFRLFSRELIELIKIESTVGFTYSIELLVKCERLGLKIGEVPAKWEERTKGDSRFKIMHWAPSYIKWYCYGLATSWLRRGPNTVKCN